MILVHEATPEDWQAMRDARLAALREAPQAFASTAEREAAYSEQEWRSWTRVGGRGVMYLAEVAGLPEPAGMAGVLAGQDASDLIAMWVHPAARGQKVGEALIEAAAEWARSRGFDSMYLWVTESNAPARRLYERSGFTMTGERQPLPSDPAVPEIKMSRPL
jgi:GNAT superfamily N-acetyltransferase